MGVETVHGLVFALNNIKNRKPNLTKIFIVIEISKKKNYLRIKRMQGKLSVPGKLKSPRRTEVRKCGTVGARNGIFPITMKYNKTPRAQISTGPPM